MAAIEVMEARLKDASLTPSAQVLAAMEQGGLSHQELSLALAKTSSVSLATKPVLRAQARVE